MKKTVFKVVGAIGVALIVVSFFWLMHTSGTTQEARIQMLEGGLSYAEFSKINYESSKPINLEIFGGALLLTGLIGYFAVDLKGEK